MHLSIYLIEIVPLAYRTAAAISKPVVQSKSIISGNSQGDKRASTDAAEKRGSTGKSTGSTTVAGATEDDAQREVVSKRLEALGYRVGQGLVERSVSFQDRKIRVAQAQN